MKAGPETAAIGRFLDRIRFLFWGAAVVPALARCLAVAAVAVVLNTLVAERSASGPWVIFAVALSGSLGLAAAVVRLARSLAWPSRVTAARRVQTVQPELRNDVESSLELAPLLGVAGPVAVSVPLVGALVAGTAGRLAERPPRRSVSWRESRRWALLLAMVLVPLGALALTGGIRGATVRALVDPRVYWPLGRIELAVEPGDTRIARGRDLVVRVRAAGARPGTLLVGYEGAAGEGVAAMERGPDGVWSWRFVAVTGDFRYRALAGATATPWYTVIVSDAPVAGNFEVRYTYPAYSGLETRLVSGRGDLEALRGTTADITFSASVVLTRAVALSGANRTPAAPAGERRYHATLYLNGEPAYRLELEDAAGLGNGGVPEYAIRYLPDAAPTVEVLEPTGEIESEPRGTVTVRYRAADDYGLSRLELVARGAAGERRLPLGLGVGRRAVAGEYSWDLGPLDAAPGEVIGAFVEAADNDTISGPKVSASASFLVRIADPRARREGTREEMDKLSEDLLQLLGDELDLQERYEELQRQAENWERFPWEAAAEAVTRQQSARAAAASAEERADRLAEALDRDPGAREETVFQADLIRQGIAELRERQLAQMQELAAGFNPGDATQDEARQKTGFLAAAAEQASGKAEQLALMAEAMKRERGLADLARGAQEMAEAEDKLLAGLERLSPGERQAAEEVLRQLDQIERSLQDLAEALLRQNKELPEEFLNSDALKDLDLQKVFDQLDRVRELLSKGDIAGARQAARDLAQQLADLKNRIREAEEEFDDKADQALARLRGNTVPQIRDLAQRQRVLLERTEALEQQAGPRLDNALREMARTRNPAPPPTEAELLTPVERGRVEALALEQEGLRGSAQRLAAEIGALRAALPFLPAEVGSNLEAAADRMTEAGGLLQRHEPGAAMPAEQAALAALQRANDQAQQSLGEIEQMQGLRRGSSGRPMVPGGGPASQATGGSASTPRRGRRSGGGRGADVRNFLIPGREDHRVPKIFREEIIKSLRDGYPPQYEERIKDYYQRITE